MLKCYMFFKGHPKFEFIEIKLLAYWHTYGDTAKLPAMEDEMKEQLLAYMKETSRLIVN